MHTPMFKQIQSFEIVITDEMAIQELEKSNHHLVEMYRDFRSKGGNILDSYQKTIAAYERIKTAVSRRANS